jgi:hypothetical protein
MALPFTMKKYQNPSRYNNYYNSIITNLQISTQAPKYIIFQKSSYIKNRPIINNIIISSWGPKSIKPFINSLSIQGQQQNTAQETRPKRLA